jgi:hypothetical protein
MDHVVAKLNVGKGASFKHSKKNNEKGWDASGIFAVAALTTGIFAVATGPVGAGLTALSGSSWLMSAICACVEDDEPELNDPFACQTDHNFLDFQKMVDKLMSQARSCKRLQHRILEDPEKLRASAGLATDLFRIDVGQTAVLPDAHAPEVLHSRR